MNLGRKWDEQRLRQQILELQKKWDLLSEKLSRVERDKILKTDPEEIFRLEQRIAEITVEREQVEQQLNTLEAQLLSKAPGQKDEGSIDVEPPGSSSNYKYLFQTIILAFFIFLIFFIPYLHLIELKTLDWKFKTQQRYKNYKNKGQITIKKEKIVIVALGDNFLEDNTLSRKKLAHLIQGLSAKNPEVIGLDVLLDKSKEGDLELSKAIKTAGNVVLPFELKVKNSEQTPEILFPLSEFNNIAEIGFANFSKHSIDGVVRELRPLEIRKENVIYFPFALQILMSCRTGTEIEKILEGNPDNTESLRINFDGEDQFIILTSEDLESGVFKNFYYEDKILLVGYLGEKQQDDTFLTPLSGRSKKMKGVFVHANILRTITGERYIRSWRFVDLIIVLLFAFGGAYLFPKLHWITKLAILPITWAFYIIIVLCLFLVGIDIPVWSPMLTLTLTTFLGLHTSK